MIAREARATQARGNVAPAEHEALRGQPIEVRRLDLWMSLETVVRPAVIVGDDQNDIGPLSRTFFAASVCLGTERDGDPHGVQPARHTG